MEGHGSRPRVTRRALLGCVVVVGLTVGVVGTLLPSMVGLPLDRFPFFAQVTAFRVHIATLGLAVAVTSAMLWSKSAAIVLGAAALVSLGGSVRHGIPARPTFGCWSST